MILTYYDNKKVTLIDVWQDYPTAPDIGEKVLLDNIETKHRELWEVVERYYMRDKIRVLCEYCCNYDNPKLDEKEMKHGNIQKNQRD